jgi:hypothetical protein
MMAATTRLRAIKLAHTLVWAGFAGCILAIPVLTAQRQFGIATALAAIVMVEVIVLALNGWACPLTPVAARYTEDRRPNFDIYLPEWLARYNKHIFGPLYGLAIVYLAGCYLVAG